MLAGSKDTGNGWIRSRLFQRGSRHLKRISFDEIMAVRTYETGNLGNQLVVFISDPGAQRSKRTNLIWKYKKRAIKSNPNCRFLFPPQKLIFPSLWSSLIGSGSVPGLELLSEVKTHQNLILKISKKSYKNKPQLSIFISPTKVGISIPLKLPDRLVGRSRA